MAYPQEGDTKLLRALVTMLEKLSDVIYRRRWWVLGVAALLVAAAAFYGFGVFNYLNSSVTGDPRSSSERAQHILDTQLSASRVDIILLFQSPTLQVDDPTYQSEVESALAPLAQNKNIAAYSSYYETHDPSLVSRDGHETFATVRLVDQNDPHDVYGTLEREVHAPDLRISYGGSVPANQQFNDQVAQDLTQTEGYTFPLVAIALVVVFGGLVAASLPLAIGGVAIIGALVVLRFLTGFIDISIYAANLVNILGLGLAIDYALLFVTRFREEMEHQDNVTQIALRNTLRTAGRTIIFSGLTVSLSLLGLLPFPILFLRSLGIGAIAAVVVAMLSALTILPALLAVLGRRVNALSLKRIFRRSKGAPSRFAVLIPQLPLAAIVMGIAVVAALTFPLLPTVVAIALVALLGAMLLGIMPLGVDIAALAGLFGLLHILQITGATYPAGNIIVALWLGLVLDYGVIVTARFREEENHYADRRAAASLALRRAVVPVGLSAWTIITILLGVALFSSDELHRMTLSGICAMLVAMAAALLVLPGLLVLLGSKGAEYFPLDAWRRGQIASNRAIWYRLSTQVMRYPIPIIVVVVAFLVTLGLPVFHATFATPDIRSLPKAKSARYVSDQIQSNFPSSSGSQQDIAVITQGNALDPANIARLNTYVQAVQRLPHVTAVTSVVTVDPNLSVGDYQQGYANLAANPQLAGVAGELANGDATHIIVTVNTASQSATAQKTVRAIESIQAPSGIDPLVAGDTASQVDLMNGIKSHLWEALLAIILSTFALLFLMTGSLIVPLKTILMNTLSLTATFGAIVFVFQEGHGQQLLGFTSLGSVDPSQLMLLFALAFGLSMDYEVFLLSRIKEQYDQLGDNSQAVAMGLQRTGGLITSAAALLAIVLLATATSQIIFVKQVGLGLAIAVLMDATLVRGLLVPATMQLLGKWNWWPRARSFAEHDEQYSEPVQPDRALVE